MLLFQRETLKASVLRHMAALGSEQSSLHMNRAQAEDGTQLLPCVCWLLFLAVLEAPVNLWLESEALRDAASRLSSRAQLHAGNQHLPSLHVPHTGSGCLGSQGTQHDMGDLRAASGHTQPTTAGEQVPVQSMLLWIFPKIKQLGCCWTWDLVLFHCSSCFPSFFLPGLGPFITTQ